MASRKPNPWGNQRIDLRGVKLSCAQKEWLIFEIVYFDKKVNYIRDRYNLNDNTLHKWVRRYKKDKVVHSISGRPRLFSSPEVKKITNEISGKMHNVTEADFAKTFQEYNVSKVMDATGIAKCSVREISRRSLGRIREKADLVRGNAEQNTDARAAATADKRNSISVAVALQLMTRLTRPELLINADGTVFQTSGGLTNSVKVLYNAAAQKSKGTSLKVDAVKGASLTAYFVKFYLCMNATGSTAPPVFILADDHMKESEIDVHLVKGMGIGTDLNADGWVVFAKTRSVNPEFYRWWFTTVFCKFVLDLKIRYNINNDVVCFFTLDGEDTQLKPMKTADVRMKCEELNIVIGKPPASTTSTTQPCDVGKVFLGAKTKKRHIKSNDSVQEFTMTETLKEMIKKHEAIVGKKMKGNHASAAVKGLQTALYSLQTTLRKDIIVESFEKTGQYDRVTGGCNIDTILGQCKSKFTTEEVQLVWEHLPKLCDIMKRNGELKEKDYDTLGIGIMSEDQNTCRDNLVLNRRRFIFLTNPALIVSEEQKRLDKLTAIDDKAEKAGKRKAAADERKANPKPKKIAKKNQVLQVNLSA